MQTVHTIPPYVRSSDWEEAPLYRLRSRRASTGTVEQDIPGSVSYGSRWAGFMEATIANRPPVLTTSQRERAHALWEDYDARGAERRREMELGREHFAKQQQPPPKTTREHISSCIQYNLKESASAPFLLRLFQLAMSTASLSLGAEIFQMFHNQQSILRNPACKRGATTYMAIAVGASGVIYTACMAGDELLAPPIGIRKPSRKLKLLLMDLFFVVFMSANASLAWAALWADSFPCGKGSDSCPNEEVGICERQGALIAVLMIAVIAWVGTLSMNLYRLVYTVERMALDLY